MDLFVDGNYFQIEARNFQEISSAEFIATFDFSISNTELTVLKTEAVRLLYRWEIKVYYTETAEEIPNVVWYVLHVEDDEFAIYFDDA